MGRCVQVEVPIQAEQETHGWRLAVQFSGPVLRLGEQGLPSTALTVLSADCVMAEVTGSGTNWELASKEWCVTITLNKLYSFVCILDIRYIS